MASARTPSPAEGNEHIGSAPASHDGLSPDLTVNPIAYANMSMHMFPFPSGTLPSPTLRCKRRQVKNACTNCQKACKKCDDARPCLRCVKYGVVDDCIDSQRKERRKGVKRGPYKKREGKSHEDSDAPDKESGLTMVPSMAPGMVPALPAGVTPMGMPMHMMAPMGYHPAFYGQMPPMIASAPSKPGEPAYYPLIYMPPPPPPQSGGQDSEASAAAYAQAASQFYPTFVPYPQPYPAYMMPHPGMRPDGPVMMVPPPQFTYPQYHGKPPSTGSPSGEGDARREVRDGQMDGK